MNLLAHLSYIAVLDYLFFQYWFVVANRYTVLNFHESGFLPGRYIISGLVAGAFVYWLYLVPLSLMKHLNPHYWHPRWGLLWTATALVTSLQTALIVMGGTTLPLLGSSSPPLGATSALALVVHLQAVHAIMLLVADRYLHTDRRVILPGVRSALVFMLMWLGWIGYSFYHTPQADPRPLIGTPLERGIMVVMLLALIGVGIAYRLRWRVLADWETVIIPTPAITLADLIEGFYGAWATFYLALPILQYLIRGYVIAHSNLFPAFLLGMLIPLLWSLATMWGIILWKNAPWRTQPNWPRWTEWVR